MSGSDHHKVSGPAESSSFLFLFFLFGVFSPDFYSCFLSVYFLIFDSCMQQTC